MSELRTSIKDVPIANDRITHEVSRLQKVPQTEVRKIMAFVGEYITGVIREGAMETVMLPGFGKFKPKPKAIRAYQNTAMQKRNGKEIVIRALRGRKNIIPKPPNETI
jgi:nucleoid DNA-binding protein